MSAERSEEGRPQESTDAMRLVVLAPTRVVVDQTARKVVAEAGNGMFCLLPRHADFVAALVPGILYFVDGEARQRYVAVDEGILVKRGSVVSVSCYEAVLGTALDELQHMVADRYLELDEEQRLARSTLARLEAGTVRALFDVVQEARSA
jgi:F-type H+-transporting ATPase subunit epsilon